jgi:mRNA interferase MazF
VPGTNLVRGRVYGAKLPHIDDEKYYLVVSNNRRNQRFPQVLAARLTTSPKPAAPSIVQLGSGEVFTGCVVCDDIETLWPDEVTRDLGALSPAAMARVGDGLRAALSL